MLDLQLNMPSEWLYVGISKARHITDDLYSMAWLLLLGKH